MISRPPNVSKLLLWSIRKLKDFIPSRNANNFIYYNPANVVKIWFRDHNLSSLSGSFENNLWIFKKLNHCRSRAIQYRTARYRIKFLNIILLFLISSLVRWAAFMYLCSANCAFIRRFLDTFRWPIFQPLLLNTEAGNLPFHALACWNGAGLQSPRPH